MASDPLGDGRPDHAVLRVRTNRHRHLWTIAICFPLACVLAWLIPDRTDPVNQLISGFILGIPGGLAGGSLALLFRKDYLTYDLRSRTIRGPSLWRNRTNYPRRGYERIEYSVYDGRIYEVREDGKRRRLIITRWVADQRDWRVLVDLLIASAGSGQEREGSDVSGPDDVEVAVVDRGHLADTESLGERDD